MSAGLAATLRQRLAPLRGRWTALALRERRALTGVAVLVLLALVWLIGVQPAWRTLRSAPAELARLDLQWQAMQRQAADARALRDAPTITQAAAVQALQGATQRLGLSGRLSLQGDRAVLTVQDLDPALLRDWLTEVRSGARARPLEANLTRGANGFNGSVVVAIGGRS